MAKGAGCTPEFKAKAVGLLTESRGSYPSETRAVEQVARDPGVAPETLRRWRDKTDATVAAETRQSAGDAMDVQVYGLVTLLPAVLRHKGVSSRSGRPRKRHHLATRRFI